MSTYYISFASDKGFRGVTVVEADDPEDAITVATRLGLNPGGEAAIWEIPATEEEAIKYKNRLIGIDELRSNGSTRCGDLQVEVQDAVFQHAHQVCEECNPVIRN
jgi:hypothetical protein